MKRFLFVSLALVGVMAATPSARATVPAPGGTSTTISTTPLAGLTFVDQFSAAPAPIAPPGGVTQIIFGTYQEWVYRNAAGNLVFMEQVKLAAVSEAVQRLTVSGYAGFTTDVSYISPNALATDVPPTAFTDGIVPNAGAGASVIDRSPAPGNVVGFDFAVTNITAGTNSVVLVITTNATAYNRSGVLSVIDGGSSSNPTFAPTVVPEPSSLALAGIGALGLIGYGLRRRKALGA